MIKAYFDGACEPNTPTGRMAYGAVIYQHEEKIHEISYQYKPKDGISSNNVAEYCGAIAVMRYLLDAKLHYSENYIFGDSKLVIEQLKGSWTANKGAYLPYYKIAISLACQFTDTHFEWIARERNTEADALSRRCL